MEADAAAEAILTRRDTEKKLVSTLDQEMIRPWGRIWFMKWKMWRPLEASLSKHWAWMRELCEAKIKIEYAGVLRLLAENKESF